MPKERSYIELSALPLDHLNDGIGLPAILDATKYGPITEDDKHEVVVLKEAFVLVDTRRHRVGVVTRSDKDHVSQVGDCSILLCGNFDRTECTLTPDGTIIYDVKDRLHNYIREISGLFVESRRKSLPCVFYHDKEKSKRYLFLLFELRCDSREIPLCYHLDNRAEDLFIGMRDLADIKRGVERYNRTPFQIDKALVGVFPRGGKLHFLRSKFSVIEKIVDAKLASFTLIKFNLIGI